MVFDYLKFLLRSSNQHSLHSPFLFDFYQNTINKPLNIGDFKKIENLRKNLKANHEFIEVLDFGAGSKHNHSNRRKISEITKKSEKAPKIAQFLHKTIQHFNYTTVFDLGTSFGLTTSYLASSNSENHVHSFEGCPNTAQIAQQNFDFLSLKNIHLTIGNLDHTLEKKVNSVEKIDFVFFDANHRLAPTISYFETCLEKSHDESCFVFDDIYWSEEMKEAWKYIKKHPKVMISIDFFWIGVVFFRKNQPKQHFTLRL